MSDVDLWVCPLCGGAEVEHLVWADPNTNEVLDNVSNDEDHWCRTCEAHVREFVMKPADAPPVHTYEIVVGRVVYATVRVDAAYRNVAIEEALARARNGGMEFAPAGPEFAPAGPVSSRIGVYGVVDCGPAAQPAKDTP